VIARPSPRTGRLCAGLRVGLLGGSFNPAHDGHRFISLLALKSLRLDLVWWLVSPLNPLKSAADMADLASRARIARAMVRHDPRILVTTLESDLGTRYTVDTLGALKACHPRTRFVWLMGADNLAGFDRWRNWERIFRTVPIAVFRRPTYSLAASRAKAARRFARRRIDAREAESLAGRTAPAWVFLRNPTHPASATAIRTAERAVSIDHSHTMGLKP